MKQSQKISTFIFLVFSILWLQPLYSMQAEQVNHGKWYNPLSWVYSFYHNFGWVTPSVAEKIIDTRVNNIIRYVELVFGDILDENDRFAQNLSKDGQRVQQQFELIEARFSKLDFESLQKLITLKLMAARTKKMLDEKLDKLYLISQNYSQTQEMIQKRIEEISTENNFSKEALMRNIQMISSIKQKFKDRNIVLQNTQKDHHQSHQEQVSQIQSEQQEFYRQTKEDLIRVKQTTEHIEKHGKEKELNPDNKKENDIVLLQSQIQNNSKRLLRLLNKLNNSNQSSIGNSTKKAVQKQQYLLSSIAPLYGVSSFENIVI